jgi:hypothetical protein
MRRWLVTAAVAVCAASWSAARTGGQSPSPADAPLPMPRFHHIHLNSVDPERSLAWYETYWPRGRRTTYAGFPAFHDDIYLLYTRVDRQAPGAFDRKLQRSVPQSAFWTFGSTFTDTAALHARLKALGSKDFEFLPVYTGPDDDVGVERSSQGPYGDELLTLTQLRERAARESREPRTGPRPGNQDFGYLVDPDGMLVEFNLGPRENFWGHHHYWHEQPLCAANWYVEHLGFQLPPVRDPATGEMVPRPLHEPCGVPIGEVSYPSFIRAGQLRIPIGTVRFANGGFSWYTRQCRFGRCGPGNDAPLSPSRGQVVDHIALAYPDLDAVIAHLKAKKVRILEGPYMLGDSRAVLIEDLDRLAVELVEEKAPVQGQERARQ